MNGSCGQSCRERSLAKGQQSDQRRELEGREGRRKGQSGLLDGVGTRATVEEMGVQGPEKALQRQHGGAKNNSAIVL